MTDKPYSLDTYDFELPEDRIAQHPSSKRDHSKLLVVNRENGLLEQAVFSDIGQHLPKNCLLVANNSRVIPARLHGKRPSGGMVEFLLLTPLPLVEPTDAGHGLFQAEMNGLLRSSKRLGPGERVHFSENMKLEVLERFEFGRCRVLLTWRGSLEETFTSQGEMPLPPYIRRLDSTEDRERYQTTYARNDKTGSVAAPTAGLHFTPHLREQLVREGHDWAELTLYVGYGTFSPVRCEDIREHTMHGEYVEIGEECAMKIDRARAEGRPVVAVGTTTVRSLEGACAIIGRPGPFSGWIDIYINPGFRFQVVDAMITNFHLPKSSLMIMVSAFAGLDQIRRAYSKAIENGYRFFSYGDSMLIR